MFPTVIQSNCFRGMLGGRNPNLFGGCFGLGSGPFRLSVCCFSDETQVWLGFAGRLAGLCVVVVVVICLHFQTVLVLVQSDVLPLMLM